MRQPKTQLLLRLVQLLLPLVLLPTLPRPLVLPLQTLVKQLWLLVLVQLTLPKQLVVLLLMLPRTPLATQPKPLQKLLLPQ